MSIRANPTVFPFKRIQTSYMSIIFFCLAAMLFCAGAGADPLGLVDTAGSTWCELQFGCQNSGPLIARDSSDGTVFIVWTYAPYMFDFRRQSFFNYLRPDSGWAYPDSGYEMFPSVYHHEHHSVLLTSDSSRLGKLEVVLDPFDAFTGTMRAWWAGDHFECARVDTALPPNDMGPIAALARNGFVQLLSFEFPNGVLYYANYNIGPYTFSGWQPVDTLTYCTYNVANSPTGGPVGIAYLRQRDFSGDWNSKQPDQDVYLVVSPDGVQWNWQERHNITDFAESDPFRASRDCDVAFDYSGNIHVAFSTIEAKINRSHPESTLTNPYMYFIWHWDQVSDSFTVAAEGWVPDPGEGFWFRGCRQLVGWPQLAIDSRSGYLYLLYERNVPEDFSYYGYPNTDLWITVSTDNGLNWSVGTNITDTQTPNCHPGECASEIQASLCEAVNDTLHLAYILDTDAGFWQYHEAMQSEAKVIYQKLPVGLIPTTPLIGQFSIKEGPVRCHYRPGDINGNGERNGVDISYAVSFFKGHGPSPTDTCHCLGTPTVFYGAGDVNGNCIFNGVDVTYFVNYLKGLNEGLSFCETCSPDPL